MLRDSPILGSGRLEATRAATKTLTNKQKCAQKRDLTRMVRTEKLMAWRMNKADTLSMMCHGNRENEKSTVTQQVLVLWWLGCSFSWKLDSSNQTTSRSCTSGAAGVCLPKASSQGDNHKRKLRKTEQSIFTGESARNHHHGYSHEGQLPNENQKLAWKCVDCTTKERREVEWN